MVTGASKGIGLAIVEALVEEGAAVVAGARHVDALAGRRCRRRRRPRPRPRARPAGRRRRARSSAAARHPGQQRRRGRPAPGGFLAVTDESGWAADAQLPRRRAHHPRRAPAPARRRRRDDRHRQLGQRVPARPGGDRLLRRQGRAGQLLQVAVEGGRAARHPGQHRQPGPGRHRPVAGRRRRRRDASARRRRRRRRGRQAQAAAGGDRPVHHARARSPTWWCCWPATAPATSPARTS